MADEQNYPIPHPRLEVISHTFGKAIQIGSTVGALVGVPVAVFRNNERSAQGVLTVAGRFGAYGAAAASVAAVPLLAYKFSGMDADGAYDRAFRLRENKRQNRAAKFAMTGAVIGGLAGAAQSFKAGGGNMAQSVVSGAAVGVAGAVLAHLATAGLPSKQVNIKDM